uniref:Replication timing regulatory factor 1 n=1 Tax=Pavo cristatus TaxID=9049 RepID=A0A8C9FNN3_PAVCR
MTGTVSAAAGLRPLLETLQDPAAPAGDLTDAHLSLVNRLSGEEGKEFVAGIRKHFPRLCKVFKAHISSENSELSNAALQALGFCVFNSKITSELSGKQTNFIEDLLSTLNSIAVKTSDKNTRTRALWVISKQTFPSEIIKKEVSSLISTLETILTKGDVQSMIVEYEALNVVIRLMEQAPAQMGEEAVRWAKLIIPLVVHSAHKVQLRGATALEIGMPLLLQKQQEVAAVTEHLMTTKLISELQKLFSTKNETYVLKLWPLFVKLLGKTLHRSGSFINSLLQLEELGFRSGSPVVKKIAFIAWKSLIDNFALNPDILCSAKRLKLLMQPLSSIHVRTEALALTKLEVWWYLLMRLGPQLPANFEQVCIPLIQSTLSVDSPAALQGTPSRVPSNPNLANPPQKPGMEGQASTPRMNLNSSTAGLVAIPSIQLLGIEMLLHFLMGPEVLDFAKRNKLVLSLVRFIPGNKKEKQGSELLTMLLQALKNMVRSNSLPVQKILSLIDITVKELPPKVLGSPAYQIADMDLLNGTPALFLVQLPFHNNLLEWCVTDERFFIILEALMRYVLSGPSSPLAFSESVLCVINQNAKQVENKEHLWRMWSIVVNPLTDWINRTNEVNQGDALEHNFNAVYNALLLPVSHIFPVEEFPQPTMKSLLRAWSDLYRAFARCAALVATAEENLCCEELCAKIISGLEGETPMPAMLDGLTHVVAVMVDCINFKYVRIASSLPQLEKLLAEIILCLQSHCTGCYDSELLEQLSPLLCVLFQHKSKQIRKQCANFWNTTFAKAASLAYPEELKPVLSQAKQKMPLLLPGFESIAVADEQSGPFSDEVNVLFPLWVFNFGEGLEKSGTETASKESLIGNENTSNVSSSSTSSDVISGTPQPASRRQSFITLEKFDSSESRPFSPSALSSVSEMSRSAPVPDKQGNINMCKAGHKPGKSGEENKKSSQAEQVSAAKRRLTRRQSKMEQQGNQQSKLLTNSEQEKSAQESFVSNSTENSPESSCSMEDTERILTAQPQPVSSAEPETKRTEGVIAEIEKVRALEMDSKENTPPKMAVSSEQATGDGSQGPHASLSQKTLRRSSRRRSDNAEMAAGSQDKEDGYQKKDRRKDDEKALQKKVPQAKEDASQKQKAVCGKASECANKKESGLPERSAAEDLGSKEPPAPKGADEEANRSARKSEETLKSDTEGQDCSSDTAGEKKRERPRYHTRRSSQGLLSSIENAEADGSETKKESLKKKSGKTKNKSDSLEGKWKDVQPDSQSHEVSSQVDGSKNLLGMNGSELSSEVSTDAALMPAPSDVKNQVLLAGAGGAERSASSKTSASTQNASVEQSKAGVLTESFSDRCVSDEVLKGEEKKCIEKQRSAEQHSSVQPEDAQGASASGSDLSSSQMQDCQHKRSKRVRKVKSCDCCSKRMKQQTSLSESKNEDPHELIEPRTTPVQAAVRTAEVSDSSNLEESLSLTPCAMSTPLPPAKESTMLSLERERTCEDNLQGSSGAMEEEVENPAHTAGEISDPVVDIKVKEEADENDRAEQCVSVSECASGESSDSSVAGGDQSEEKAAVEKEEKSQHGDMEEIPEALADGSKPETKQMDELQGNQDSKEKAENALEEVCITAGSEMREELLEAEITVPENMAVGNEDGVENQSADSPQKPEGLDSFVSVNGSPSGVQARCTWSPSASPSTSILKRGVKRHQEDDSLSPANKIRRVSFANPIYQEGLADDIDRRSPVVRSHSSPSSRSLKILSTIQTKHVTTPTKGFLSPGSRNPKFKSSKKCLMTEMVKESLPSPTECVYPALAGCKAPVDVILPQITSNICARGLGQLIRAKNIKTVGDLSTLTASEIKTLPIRSPKVSNVKKALRGYHEQQVKSRGCEEIGALEDVERTVSSAEDKSPVDEEKLATDLGEPVALSSSSPPPADLLSQLDVLAAQLTSEDLRSYPGSRLFEMQEKLASMTDCIMRTLRSRWRSPPHDSAE